MPNTCCKATATDAAGQNFVPHALQTDSIACMMTRRSHHKKIHKWLEGVTSRIIQDTISNLLREDLEGEGPYGMDVWGV